MNRIPYVRCVGIGTGVYQNNMKKSYDYRMIFIICGDGEIHIENKVCKTKSNQIYIIYPGESFRVCSDSNQKIAVVNFDGSYEYSNVSNPVLSVDEDAFLPNEIMHTPPLPFSGEFIPYMSNECIDIINSLYHTYIRNEISAPHKEAVLSAKFLNIWMNVLDFSCYKAHESQSGEIYSYIIDNATSSLTLKDVALHFNFSTSYIEKALRKNYSTSFKQLIVDTRMKKAVWLLENTSLTCTEISSQLGFYSSQHFSKMFRNKFGKKPTELKKFNHNQ